jgi:hypothetical protein
MIDFSIIDKQMRRAVESARARAHFSLAALSRSEKSLENWSGALSFLLSFGESGSEKVGGK